ncbi:MAG: hypothetical protein JW820_05835, partial [Spirochaetales bacterium]|nr:hypothetical protein [Spirochaetales bacterium]
MKKLLITLLMLGLAGFAFAGGAAEEPVETVQEAAEEVVEEVVEEEPGTGVPYKSPIDIGTKNFTEQFVVGNLMYLFLESRGFDVELKTGMSSTVLREAMENGSLDLCMDYTGTQWLSYTGHEFKGESPEQMYDQVEENDTERGLVWMDPIWCNNTYAIAVTREFSQD